MPSSSTVPDRRMDRNTDVDVRPVLGPREYEGEVRRTLLALGSNNPDGDLQFSGKYWEHCREAGIEPEVCAATIYTGIRHRHTGDKTSAQTATLREVAEGVAEEELLTWKEHGGGDWSAPGLGGTYHLYPKPGGGYTAEFDQHGTAAVQLGSFGTFGAAAAACRRHSDENDQKKTEKKAAETSVAAETDASALAAAEPVAVIHEPTVTVGIPWVKVTRDVDRYEACVKKADKIGPIATPVKVYELLGDALNKEDQELFVVILLDLRGNLRGVCEVARGQRSRVTVGVADVMRPVIAGGAEGFICCHQHPSGKVAPSKSDLDLTKHIREATRPYGKDVCFIDHCVIGLGRIHSIVEGKTYKC